MRSEKARKVSTVVSTVSEVSTLITAVTSVHLPKPVSTDLTIMPDSVLTNPIRKDGVRSWSIKFIYPIRHFYCDIITKRVANQD